MLGIYIFLTGNKCFHVCFVSYQTLCLFTLHNAEEMKLSGKCTRLPDAYGVKTLSYSSFFTFGEWAQLTTLFVFRVQTRLLV